MRFRILIFFSIISVVLATTLSLSHTTEEAKLSLKQQILVLENNALRNIMREQNLYKRNQILVEALGAIQKVRDQAPMQLQADEKAIIKIVQNLKELNAQNQAQYRRGE